MAAILNSAILNSTILDSAILVFPLKLTHTCQDWFPPFAQKNCHSFILTQLDDGPHLEFCHLGFSHFAQNSDSNLFNLTQTNSIWLTWWWLPSWILPSWIQPFCTKLWLILIQSDSNLFILTQLDDGSHLEFCHLGFRHLSFSSQTHSHLPRLVPTICTKNFTHSFWLNLMMTAILNSTMLDSDTAILDSDIFLSSLRFTLKHSPSTLNQTNSIWLTWWWLPSWHFCHLGFSHFGQNSDSNLFILTQTHSFWLNLLMAAMLNSAILNLAILDSATLVFLLKLTPTCQD